VVLSFRTVSRASVPVLSLASAAAAVSTHEMSHREEGNPVSTELTSAELPAAVRGFVEGWQARDADDVEALFVENAVVSDEGRTYRGRPEIRTWIDSSINLFSTTVTFLRAREMDGVLGASYRLEGDFPGGVVDLEYQFRLDDNGQIVQLDFADADADGVA